MTAVSRRTFLHAATAAAAVGTTWRPRRVRAEQGARGSISVTLPLATFPYADVQLLDGPMKRQFDENHERFLHVDDDRLLKVFRQVAGMPAPGADMAAGTISRASAWTPRTFTVSSRGTRSASTSRVSRARTRSRARSPRAPRSAGWSRGTP